MQNETIGYRFQADFYRENRREEVVKVRQDLVPLRIGINGILGGKHSRRDHDANEDDVTKVAVIANPMTEYAKRIGLREDEERGSRWDRYDLRAHVEFRHTPRTCAHLIIDILIYANYRYI